MEDRNDDNSFKSPIFNTLGKQISNNGVSYLSLIKKAKKIEKLIIPKQFEKLNYEDTYIINRNPIKNSQNYIKGDEDFKNLTWALKLPQSQESQVSEPLIQYIRNKENNLKKFVIPNEIYYLNPPIIPFGSHKGITSFKKL